MSSRDLGHHEWACLASQQAAEEALKALIRARGGEARGHSVRGLLASLPADLLADSAHEAPQSAARELDRHYIPARYPNSLPDGAPFEVYDAEQSERALDAADRILRFCQRHLA